MKNLSILILALILAFSISSCNPGDPDDTQEGRAGDAEIEITTMATSGEGGSIPTVERHMGTEKSIEAEIRALDKFRVVGMGTTCSYDDTSSIEQLWESFLIRMEEVENPGPTWGISFPSEDGFFYLACAEVVTDGEIPEGMESREIDAGTYAVFEFEDKPENMSLFIDSIINEFLPSSKFAYDMDFGIILELYPEDSFDDETGNMKAEILVPVYYDKGKDLSNGSGKGFHQ